MSSEQEPKHQRRDPSLPSVADVRSFLLGVALPIVITIAAVVYLVPPARWPAAPAERARRLVEVGLPGVAEQVLEEALWSDPYSLELVGLLVHSHFRRPSRENNQERDDAGFLRSLRARTTEYPPLQQYAEGLYELERNEPLRALELFDLAGREIEEVRVARGRALRLLDRHREVIDDLEPLVGYPVATRKRALWEMAWSLRALGRWDRLRQLLASDAALLPFPVVGSLLLHDGELLAYLRHSFSFMYGGLWRAPSLVVLLGSFVWLLFLHKAREGEANLLLRCVAVLGGAGAALLVVLFVEVKGLLTTFTKTGGALNDLAFFVLGVGLPEEMAKLVPLLFVARLSKRAVDPADWILYGALSGLGFATIENLRYVSVLGTAPVLARSFISVLLHMCCTGVIAAAIPEARARSAPPAKLLVLAVMFAAVVHGLFNWFVSRSQGLWALLGLVLLFLIARCFMHALGNEIASRLNSPERTPERRQLGWHLAHGAVLVACALCLVQAFELPLEYRGRVLARSGLILFGLWLPLFAMTGLYIPAERDPFWLRKVLNRTDGAP